MDYVKAKIKETGKETVLYKLIGEGGELFLDTEGRQYQPEEVEVLKDWSESQSQPQPDDPLAQLPQEMVQMVTDMVNGYIDRFDAMYWQRQRVEIVKTLMNRLDLTTNDPITICNLADQYIRMLKNYE